MGQNSAPPPVPAEALRQEFEHKPSLGEYFKAVLVTQLAKPMYFVWPALALFNGWSQTRELLMQRRWVWAIGLLAALWLLGMLLLCLTSFVMVLIHQMSGHISKKPTLHILDAQGLTERSEAVEVKLPFSAVQSSMEFGGLIILRRGGMNANGFPVQVLRPEILAMLREQMKDKKDWVWELLGKRTPWVALGLLAFSLFAGFYTYRTETRSTGTPMAYADGQRLVIRLDDVRMGVQERSFMAPKDGRGMAAMVNTTRVIVAGPEPGKVWEKAFEDRGTLVDKGPELYWVVYGEDGVKAALLLKGEEWVAADLPQAAEGDEVAETVWKQLNAWDPSPPMPAMDLKAFKDLLVKLPSRSIHATLPMAGGKALLTFERRMALEGVGEGWKTSLKLPDGTVKALADESAGPYYLGRKAYEARFPKKAVRS
jgi:hypothetical protein